MENKAANRSIKQTQVEHDAIAVRLQRMLSMEIHYTGNPLNWGQPSLVLSVSLNSVRRLAAAQEVALFRAFNFAKYRADCLRRVLSTREPSQETMREIDWLIRRATEIRNQLVRIFLNLGVSVARQFASAEFPLDELASEASMTLLRAVEKFDCDRGFRFCTYATHAIRRNILRYIKRRRKERLLVMPVTKLDVFEDGRKWTFGYEKKVGEESAALEKIMEALRPREQFILRSRYGLGQTVGAQSLQNIADVLGVSRERIRQLECRATDRLRCMAKKQMVESLEA